MLKVGIVLSTTRATRLADQPAAWLLAHLGKRDDMQAELLDLRDYPMPFFDEPASNMWMPSKNEVAQRWQRKVAEFDAFVFVTAEYNHSVPAALKNALDYSGPEWARKPAACFGYGSVGAARAVEQLRLILLELQMAPVRASVHIQGADFLALMKRQRKVDELAYLPALATAMLDDLAWWGGALRRARSPV